MTHLHFDHCGGSINYNKDRTKLEPAFKNAHFWSNKDHWKWATQPNRREVASFLKENILPMEESGHLKFTSIPQNDILKNSELGFDIFFADGHTEKQMIPMINYKGKTICFMADLLPTVGHLPLPFVMGYETRPLLTLDEKEKFLNAIPAIQPVANKDITRIASGYGMRSDPFTKERKMHWGMDFTSPRGTPVYATGNGTVERADNNATGYGNHIRIDHGYGYVSLYAHLYKYNVRRGQKVQRGD